MFKHNCQEDPFAMQNSQQRVAEMGRAFDRRTEVLYRKVWANLLQPLPSPGHSTEGQACKALLKTAWALLFSKANNARLLASHPLLKWWEVQKLLGVWYKGSPLEKNKLWLLATIPLQRERQAKSS